MNKLAIALVALPSWAFAQGCPVPPPAAAVGYNQITFGPVMELGQTWHPFTGDNSSSGVTPNANGTVTINKSPTWHYNDQINTGNVAFGGGGYFVATLSIKNPIAGWSQNADGWPAWWAAAVEISGPTGYTVETDFVEFMAAGGKNFESGMHTWSQHGEVTNSLAQGVHTTATLPASTDLSQPHQYGWLWVPASGQSKGYTKMFFDNQQVGPTHTWSKGGAFSALDGEHLQLKLGTGSANPMTVYGVSVWQKSDANNVGWKTAVNCTNPVVAIPNNASVGGKPLRPIR